MRVMISQPMKGLSAEEIRERRAAVVARLEAEGHEVVDTVFTETPPEEDNQALWYVGKSLQAIAGVDAVYFMEGWDKARGCRIEYEACVLYGIYAMNISLDQIVPLNIFVLMNDEARESIIDQNCSCDICSKPASMVKVSGCRVIKDDVTLVSFPEKLHWLCDEHDQAIRDEIYENIPLPQFARFMTSYLSKSWESLGISSQNFLKRIVQNFLEGLKPSNQDS